ncbi:MAG: ATP synthase F1 subunit epsilon [Rhodospirillales bacterium]|nr:ATP synthase F1 subunit epsilon [Rhodospirillales bacterium]
MADKLQFELVSPERLLLAEPVEMVVVPGSEGDFGVLKGHAPMISTVRPGVVEVHDEGTVRERIFVAGGFAEVTGERCTVLTAEASPIKDLDRGAIESDLKGLVESFNRGVEHADAERIELERRIAVAEAKLAALG